MTFIPIARSSTSQSCEICFRTIDRIIAFVKPVSMFIFFKHHSNCHNHFFFSPRKNLSRKLKVLLLFFFSGTLFEIPISAAPLRNFRSRKIVKTIYRLFHPPDVLHTMRKAIQHRAHIPFSTFGHLNNFNVSRVMCRFLPSISIWFNKQLKGEACTLYASSNKGRKYIYISICMHVYRMFEVSKRCTPLIYLYVMCMCVSEAHTIYAGKLASVIFTWGYCRGRRRKVNRGRFHWLLTTWKREREREKVKLRLLARQILSLRRRLLLLLCAAPLIFA